MQDVTPNGSIINTTNHGQTFVRITRNYTSLLRLCQLPLTCKNAVAPQFGLFQPEADEPLAGSNACPEPVEGFEVKVQV
jgi:alpha-galactosidase/6-phospho-beta-glucosidase family protein